MSRFAPRALAPIIVDAAGTGDYTTLAAAITAATAGQKIVVRSDLTITTPIVISKTVTIEWLNGTKVYNDTASSTDAITTSIAENANGQVNLVRLIRPNVSRSISGRGGKGFNFHGAFHWDVQFPEVEKHDVGFYFSATPYPSGQGSHNTLHHPRATDCGLGIQNTGYANINTLVAAATANCDKHLLHDTGLNFNILGYRVENLSGVTTELIDLDASGTYIYGLHCEGKGATPALRLRSNARAVIEGDVYIDGGSKYVLDPAARYRISLKGEPSYEHSSAADACQEVRASDWSATTTQTVFLAPRAITVRQIDVVNNGYVNYGASDYWTIQAKEYNGNVEVGNIGSLWTQGAQVGLGKTTVASSLTHELTQDRSIRLVVTKVGAPPAWSQPIVVVRYGVGKISGAA